MKLFDPVKLERVELVIRLMVATGKNKSWLQDELGRNKDTSALPIAKHMDLVEILHLCPTYMLDRISAILKGIGYDYQERKASQPERADPQDGDSDIVAGSIMDNIADSLSFVLCLKLKGRANLRFSLNKNPSASSVRSPRSTNRTGIGDELWPTLHDDELFEASMRTYLYIGRTPASTADQIAHETGLGNIVLETILRLAADGMIMEDFSDSQLYFCPHFTSALNRLLASLDAETPDKQGGGIPLVDHYAKFLLAMMLECLGDDADSVSDMVGSKELAGLTSSSNQDTRLLPSVLALPAAEIEAWKRVTSIINGETGDDFPDLSGEIAWLYSKLGLSPPKVTVVDSLSRFLEGIVSGQEEFGRILDEAKARMIEEQRLQSPDLPADGEMEILKPVLDRMAEHSVLARIARLPERRLREEQALERQIRTQVDQFRTRTGPGGEARQAGEVESFAENLRIRARMARFPTLNPLFRFRSSIDDTDFLSFYRNQFLDTANTNGMPSSADGRETPTSAANHLHFLGRPSPQGDLVGRGEESINRLVDVASSLIKGLAQPDNRLACFHFLCKLVSFSPAEFDRYFRLLSSPVIWDMYLTRDVALVCRPPAKVLIDAQGRLHSMKEAAVQWLGEQRAGSGPGEDLADREYFFLHGAKFDHGMWRRIISGEMPCAEILTIRNMEQRFAALRVYGPERLLNEINAMRISKSKRGNELYAMQMPFPERRLKLLKYKDPSTDRIYVSFVPENLVDADDAMAWKFSLTREEYDRLEIET